MSCSDCPLKGNVKVPFLGKKGVDVVIMGESGGQMEIKYKRPFIGQSGKLLFTTLEYFCDLGRKDVGIINAAKCMLDVNNRKETTLALKCCREYVVNALKKLKPKVIVAFGSTAMRQLTKDGSKILSKSGRFFWSDEFNCYILASIHPSYALRNGVTTASLSKDFISTSKAEKLWMDTFKKLEGFIKNNYKVVGIDTTNYVEATEKDIEYILSKKLVAFDYETNSLNPFSSKTKLLSVSFSVERGKSYVVVFDEDKKKEEWVKKILTSKQIKIVANRPFEEIWTKEKLGYEVRQPVHDVLTMAHVVNEENCQPYNLEEVANRYSGMQNIKDVAEGQRENLENVDKSLLIRYNGVDTDATYRSYKTLLKILRDEPKVLNYYKYVIYPAQTIYAELEAMGMEIDTLNMRKLETELRKKADELHTKAITYLPLRMKEKYKDNLSLSRSAIIKEYLFDVMKFKPIEFTDKTNQPTTTTKHLKNFEDKSTFVKHLLSWKKANKLLTAYFKQMYENINPEDNKIYPHTFFIAIKTGRLAIRNPSLQTIPQRGEFSSYVKKIFKAPEGWQFFDRDLSQSELRIMGWVSGCKGIMHALHNGIDLHKQTAKLVLGIPFDKITKKERQAAKAIGFGFIYGASAKTFQQIAKNDYGVIVSLEEAEELRNKFFKAYPEILDWHKEILNFARRNGYVESLLGRRRHLEFINSSDYRLRGEAERQAINFPIQSISSDINLIAQFLLHKYLKRNNMLNKMYSLFLVHDAMYGFVKDEYVELAQGLTKKAMEVWTKVYIKKHFGIKIGYPIASEFSYGKDWDSMKEVSDEAINN